MLTGWRAGGLPTEAGRQLQPQAIILPGVPARVQGLDGVSEHGQSAFNALNDAAQTGAVHVVDAAESLAVLFQALGHETHTAFDGHAALVAAERHVPHIIFLDLDMPVLDGYGAARAMRASPDTDHPFIVALTGQTGQDVQRRTDAAGFDFYMHKPANTNALLALVDDLGGRVRKS